MVRVTVRAHAARVRPLVALVRALVILREGHRDEGPAVAERLEGELLPHQFLLDEEPCRAANLLLQDLAAIRERLRLGREMIAPDAHAFPARQAQRLDHELEIRVVHERLDDRMLAAPAPDHQDLHDRDAEMVAAGISSFAHSAETRITSAAA